MKNVLIISSSPRKNGNTNTLCEQFKKGAEAKGHHVELVRIMEKKIGYCLACDSCMKNGGIWKAEIVNAARKDVPMVAYCGFSCNHCFLGEWCGGCRSVFNCCSYGTLHDKGVCPNIACCQDKGLDGCFDCDELNSCEKGFYTPGNDGANACKAQAMFIKKYGKEKFLEVHDKMHETRSFQKTQEILGEDTEKGLKILEQYL